MSPPVRRFTVVLAWLLAAGLGGWLLWRDGARGAGGSPAPASAPTVRETPPAAPRDPVPVFEEHAAAVDAFAGFHQWTARYLAARGPEREPLLAAGVALAAQRRVALAQLIPADPRAALAQAVPMTVRQQLPPEIVAQLEEWVNARGFFGVLGVFAGPQAIRREVRLDDGRRFETYTFGRRAAQPTTENAALSGIAVPNPEAPRRALLALDERPLRVLEAGELPDAAKPVVETCPISGKSTAATRAPDGTAPPITDDTPAVEIGGTIHYLCNGGHIQALEDGLIAAEGATGGATKPTGTIPGSQSTGVRSLLYLRVAFPESNREPQTEAAAYEMMRGVNDWFVENSFGNVHLVTTVAPLIILPRSEAWYKNGGGDEFDVRADAQAAARLLGYDTTQFELDIVAYTGGPGSFGGLGYVGGKGMWLKSLTVGVAAHELGHNFNLWHANYWATTDGTAIGNGANDEYGNSFDTMGSASAGDLHFNANHKAKLNWMPAQTFVTNVVSSGTYRIVAFDQPRLDPASRYALRVRKDSAREYWAEFRQRSLGSNRWTKDGILLNWSPWTNSGGGAQLLDTTPGSPDGRTDAAVVIGRTFSDPGAGVHLTPVGKGGTVPESIDVVLNLGTFPGNQAPDVEVAASTVAVATGASVNITATASDPDGDPLAYAWDFGDRTFSNTNATAVTKSWSTAGDYAVRCTVSDMKGLTDSATVLVTVGSPGTFRISGQVTADGLPLADVRVSNGQTGSSYRGAFTDADGRYTIAGLSAGSVTLTTMRSGYSFAPAGFSNPVTVGPSFTTADFTATPTPVVTLTASDADASETGGNAGTILLTRTGPITSALTVNLFTPTGTAARTSDYALAPDLTPTATYQTLSIPAGQSALAIALNPVNDSGAEGPEIAVLELAAGSGYLVGDAARAAVTIQDSDSALPVVSLRVTDANATENGEAGAFTVTRLGATAGALVVKFTVAGTATAGTDFAPVGTQVTIPDGASSVPLTIAPLNDTLVEGNETVTVTLATDAAYIRAPSSADNSGTMNLLDDDIPTLTVTAPDAAASETGADPGTFVLTRSGDPGQPLTIYYALAGTALQGVDYQPLPGVLTFAAGSKVASVTIVPIDDAIGEPAQTVYLQLRGGSGYVAGTPSNATVTISDGGDVPVVTVGVSDGACSEPGDTGKFKFTTTGSGSGNITVRYAVTGTATAGTDYTALTGTLLMGRNTTTEITVTPLNDTELEEAETVAVTITPDPAYSTHLDTAATLWLNDDDQPVVTVSTTTDFFSEASGTARFYLARTGATTDVLVVNYALGGTATNGEDYAAAPGVATIPAGSTGVSVDLTPINDPLGEGTETIVLTLAPGSYGIGLATATHYLADNDSLPLLVRFSSGTGSGAESAGTIDVPVTLSAAAAGEVTVEYIIGGGNATAGIDYRLTPGLLVFAPGEMATTIPLTILDDIFHEPVQTVLVRLQNARGATLGTSTHAFTINDNDALPTPTIGFVAATASGAEAVTPPLIVVSLSAAQTTAVSVDFAVTGGPAVAGDDYTGGSGTLTFAPGETAKLLPLGIVNDNAMESNETVIVSLSNASGASLGAMTTHTYTITDEDAQTFTITASDASASEPASAGAFTITRTGSSAAAATVNLTRSGTATSGTDYEALPDTVAFGAGQTTVVLAVTPLDDSLGEPAETIILTLAAGDYLVGAPASATVTLADDEPVVSIVATDASAGEAGANPGTLVVSRTGAPNGELTVDLTIGGTATAGSDYTALPTPVVIPDGAASATLTVLPIDDPAEETAETVLVTLTAANGYSLGTASANVTIEDNDANTAPVIAIERPTGAATIGISGGVGLHLDATVSDDAKPPVPGVVSSTWSKLSGPGTVNFGDAAAATTTALFSAPGSYLLQLSASDGALPTSRQLGVIVGGGAWTGTTINGATPAGSIEQSGAAFTVRGGGANITASSDQFYFAQQAVTGDFRLTARVASFTGGNSSAKAGLIFRTSTAPGAAGGCISLYGPANTSQTGSWRYRAVDGGSYATRGMDGARTFPNWVRLTRSGGLLTGEVSANGTAWTSYGAVTSTLPAAGLLGLAVTSNNTAQLATVVFDNVSLTAPDGNTGPLVHAGSAQSNTFPAPAPISGTVSDDALPAPGAVTTEWAKVSGPGAVTFADAAALATTASFSAPGSYVLRLSADDGAIRTFHDVAITHLLPSVSAAATVAAASEFGPVNGSVTLTRTGSATAALTVHFTMSGTALEGTDYPTPGGTATFAIGQNAVAIAIVPLADMLAEGSETAKLTLSEDAAYSIGAAPGATVTIADLPLDGWRAARFGNAANDPLIAGDFADPDGDGRANWFEFSLADDPLSSARINFPQFAIEGADLTLIYRRPSQPGDLTYQIEATPDFTQPWGLTAFTEQILTDDGTTRTIKARVPIGLGDGKFIRLRVTRPEN